MDMSRITKDLAYEVATKMTQKKRESLEKMRIELKEMMTEIYLKSIPKEVMDFFNKNPKFCNVSNSVVLTQHGFNYERIYLTGDFPTGRDNGCFSITASEGKKLSKLYSKIYDEKSALNILVRDIEKSLYTLRTYKKVQDSFPEAAKYLPEKQVYLPAVNLDSIRKRLN